MSRGSRGAQLCRLAREYLLGFREQGVTPALLASYLDPKLHLERPMRLNGIYKRMLQSAQNANMRASVVGGSIGGFDRLGRVLFGFNPRRVVRAWPGGWADLLDDIEAKLEPRGKIRRTRRSIWPQFCRTCLSAASFMEQFGDAQDFYAWTDTFDRDPRLRPALPMMLSYEVEGLGFPLACDFLKELVSPNYAKPDVHIKAILRGLGFVPDRATDYLAYRAVLDIARDVRRTPYHVDKLLWLVGSGRFYDDKRIGRNGYVPTDRDAFIRKARRDIVSATAQVRGRKHRGRA